MPFRAMIEDLVVPVTLTRDDGRDGPARLQIRLVLDAHLPYRTEPGTNLDLLALVAWVRSWSGTEAASLRTRLADLIDRCFQDPRVHHVQAELWDLDAPDDVRIGVGLTVDRSVHAVLLGA